MALPSLRIGWPPFLLTPVPADDSAAALTPRADYADVRIEEAQIEICLEVLELELDALCDEGLGELHG